MLGVFDSGVGGLTVLRAIRDLLPEIDITYLGDTARVPYGDRSRTTITSYTQQCCEELFRRGCALIILACNAASSETLRTLQQEWLPERNLQNGAPTNILGVVVPIAEATVRMCPRGTVGIIATRATVSSGAYPEVFAKLSPSLRIVQQACPLLVPLLEEGWHDKPETRMVLRKYLLPLKAKNPSVLILGCTHYEIIADAAQRTVGSRCRVLRSSSVVAERVREYLNRHAEYRGRIGTGGTTTFLTTGDVDRFTDIGSYFYGKRLRRVTRVSIE